MAAPTEHVAPEGRQVCDGEGPGLSPLCDLRPLPQILLVILNIVLVQEFDKLFLARFCTILHDDARPERLCTALHH